MGLPGGRIFSSPTVPILPPRRVRVHNSEKDRNQTQLLRRLVTAQEDERRRVSRELHDQMGQHVTALLLGLDRLAVETCLQASCQRDLQRLQQVCRDLGAQIHRVAWELRPTVLDDLGLVAAIRAYLEEWSSRFGIGVEVQTPGMDGDRLSPDAEIALYRVVQEALTNVARHARATRVCLVLERQAGEVVLVVEDNGVGFRPGKLRSSGPEGGLGLLGMRERVLLVGGELQIESAHGRGTALFARVPATPAGD